MSHRSAERLAERQITRWLFEEAAEKGFECVVFACHPPTGHSDDSLRGAALGLSVEQCLAHADAWDSYSLAEFAHPSEPRRFWALLTWGAGVNVLADYGASGIDALPVARAIVDAVWKRVEE